MDFETAATKNTITTAEKDDAADVTDNEDAAEASTTKNEEAITSYEELHLYLSMNKPPKRNF